MESGEWSGAERGERRAGEGRAENGITSVPYCSNDTNDIIRVNNRGCSAMELRPGTLRRSVTLVEKRETRNEATNRNRNYCPLGHSCFRTATTTTESWAWVVVGPKNSAAENRNTAANHARAHKWLQPDGASNRTILADSGKSTK